MFCGPTTGRTARKAHRCTYCGETIEAGERYWTWSSIEDAPWFINKMHGECFDDAQEWGHAGSFEYIPFDNERPTKELVA
jgi:hypothetical protein